MIGQLLAMPSQLVYEAQRCLRTIRGDVQSNLCVVGLGEFGGLGSSPGHSTRQPPQLVLYAGKHVFGWGGPARSPTLLD